MVLLKLVCTVVSMVPTEAAERHCWAILFLLKLHNIYSLNNSQGFNMSLQTHLTRGHMVIYLPIAHTSISKGSHRWRGLERNEILLFITCARTWSRLHYKFNLILIGCQTAAQTHIQLWGGSKVIHSFLVHVCTYLSIKLSFFWVSDTMYRVMSVSTI